MKILSFIYILFLVISCGEDGNKEALGSGPGLGNSFVTAVTDLEGDSPRIVCDALQDKRFHFNQRSSLWFEFNVTINQCDGISLPNRLVRTEMEISGSTMEFRSTAVGFLRDVETDTSGMFSFICPQLIRGEVVKNVIETGDGRKLYYIFGRSGGTGVGVSVYTGIKSSTGDYVTSKIEKFIVNTTTTTGGDSDRGLVESRSLEFTCASGKKYTGSRIVIH